MHDRLSRRIAGSNDDDVLAATEAGLHIRGRVVDSSAFEVPEAWHIEAPVRDSGGNQDASRTHPGAIRQRDNTDALVNPETLDGSRNSDTRAEALRLEERVARQLRTRDASGEA